MCFDAKRSWMDQQLVRQEQDRKNKAKSSVHAKQHQVCFETHLLYVLYIIYYLFLTFLQLYTRRAKYLKG